MIPCIFFLVLFSSSYNGHSNITLIFTTRFFDNFGAEINGGSLAILVNIQSICLLSFSKPLKVKVWPRLRLHPVSPAQKRGLCIYVVFHLLFACYLRSIHRTYVLAQSAHRERKSASAGKQCGRTSPATCIQNARVAAQVRRSDPWNRKSGVDCTYEIRSTYIFFFMDCWPTRHMTL